MAISQKVLDALKASEQPLENVKPTFKAVLYGPVGVGKTYTAMSIADSVTPEGKSIIYIDYAEGWTAIQNNERIVSRSRRFTFDSFRQLEYLAEAIKEKAPGFEDVGTIVLDEYSSMVDANLEFIVDEMYKEDSSKYDQYMPEWPHFNRNKKMATRVHRRFNRIPGVNVFYIAHAKERVEQDTGKNYVEPNFNPSYGKDFLQDLQLVGYMTAEVRQDKYTRKIQVQPERRVAAKNRLGFEKTTISPAQLAEAVNIFLGKTEKPEIKKIQPVEVK